MVYGQWMELRINMSFEFLENKQVDIAKLFWEAYDV